MAEKEYIEKRKLIEAWERETENATDLYDAFDFAMEDVPAADVVEVVHARWITEENTEGYTGDPQCTACKGILDDEAVYGYTPGVDSFFYCPLCGAKMDGGRT